VTVDAAPEPKILVEHREELIYLLTEAAEIEHGLMCCYLFAAYSLKRDEPELRDGERAAIRRWRSTLIDVAREEMVHLALVSNLLCALGSAPHLARQNFPVAPGYHPAGVVISLAPFDRATLDHFVYLERPEGVALPDGAGFTSQSYHRAHRAGRLVPSAQDYATVGHLYRGIRSGFMSLAAALGESGLLVGDPRLQVGPDLVQMDGLTTVRSLRDAELAVDTIVLQGEGTMEHTSDSSHYARFRGVVREYEALLAENPSFQPGRPVARNPVMRFPPEPQGRVWISAEPAASLLDLTNATYGLMLRALAALFSSVGLEPDVRTSLGDLALLSMRTVGALAERLTTLPASPDHPGLTAGMTFTISRSLHAPPDRRGLRVVSELARAVAAGIRSRVTDEAHAGAATQFEALGLKLLSLSAAAVSII
jgi:hypothetical protein